MNDIEKAIETLMKFSDTQMKATRQHEEILKVMREKLDQQDREIADMKKEILALKG